MPNSSLAYKGPVQIMQVVEKQGKRGLFLSFVDAAVNFDDKQPAFVKQQAVGGQQTSIPMAGIPKDKMMLASYVKDIICAGKLDLATWADATDRIYDRLLNGPKQELELPTIDTNVTKEQIEEALQQPW